MISIEYLKEKIAALKEGELQSLANAHANRGAIQMCESLIADLQETPGEDREL